jgi:soluble lytic murein transglycosylase
MHHDPVQMADLILRKSALHKLDPFLVLGMIKTESDFNSLAVSNKGALGLMQIQPDTADHVVPYGDFQDEKAERLLTDNEVNISIGTMYMAKLIRRFGKLELALEAYNRGPEGLKRDLQEGDYEGPYYAGKVIQHYRKYKFGTLPS